MASGGDPSAASDNAGPRGPAKPGGVLIAWFWRPWYAKLWWTAIAAYWTLFMAQGQLPMVQRAFDDTPLGLLGLPLAPWMPLIIIGALRVARMPLTVEEAVVELEDVEDDDDDPNIGALIAGSGQSWGRYYGHPASFWGRQIRSHCRD